jgi:hypothetical protein
VAEAPLVIGLDCLIRLRWIAIAGVTLVVGLAERAFGPVSHPGELYLYAGAVVLGIGNLTFMFRHETEIESQSLQTPTHT